MSQTSPRASLAPSALTRGLARCRGGIVALLGFSAALNVIAFAGSLFSAQVFDRVLNARSEETLVFLLALQAVIKGVHSRLLVRLGLRFEDAASASIFERLIGAGIAAPRNAAYANAVRDLDQVREGLSVPSALPCLDAPFIPPLPRGLRPTSSPHQLDRR